MVVIKTEDAINPSHYKSLPGGLQVYDVIESVTTRELGVQGTTNCDIGNVLKYILRLGLKGGTLEQLEKAKWYLDRAVVREKLALELNNGKETKDKAPTTRATGPIINPH